MAASILIADDEPSVRDSVGYALAQEGFDVTAAEDGTDFTGPSRELGVATAEVHRTLARVLGTDGRVPPTRARTA